MLFRAFFLRRVCSVSASLLLCSLSFFTQAAEKLNIGITLHPYYSYVSAVVGDKANIVPLVDSGFNPHNYQPQPADMLRLQSMDVIVVNGIGHDDFAMKVLASAKRDDLPVIYANKDVPLLAAMGAAVGDSAKNAHTFVGISTTIQKVYTIATELSKIDPNNASSYRKNARLFAKKMRLLKNQAMTAIGEADTSKLKVATTHNAYNYLLQEFGIDVESVIEPAHGVEPSASQLQETIEKIKNSGINVLFYELDMPNRFVDTIEKETGVQLYRFSHMTHGQYEADKVVREMTSNVSTLIEAIQFAASQADSRTTAKAAL
ncbi:zinc ABC transporter substrate-binding protein [Vibrio sp. Of7-15]|uniref:metal ABC transporter solute-binding protein, Zn/Mn family n=1 Tax=Vibrio sp. Of7-15 TaxID=2724879 RepID=UPI001EF24055|nr:zinc ABC transporter substrate-binding protein [Vibrio sp. Of7-15]MCG7496034.1 zinc ABC transporter substrate-binding protein [Vibrio sp. Of7-15]